eukprot:gene14031-19969_t
MRWHPEMIHWSLEFYHASQTAYERERNDQNDFIREVKYSKLFWGLNELTTNGGFSVGDDAMKEVASRAVLLRTELA